MKTKEPVTNLQERAEKLAAGMYRPHRFGDGPAWFNACVRLAARALIAEDALDFYGNSEHYPLAIAEASGFKACIDGGALARAVLEERQS